MLSQSIKIKLHVLYYVTLEKFLSGLQYRVWKAKNKLKTPVNLKV